MANTYIGLQHLASATIEIYQCNMSVEIKCTINNENDRLSSLAILHINLDFSVNIDK